MKNKRIIKTGSILLFSILFLSCTTTGKENKLTLRLDPQKNTELISLQHTGSGFSGWSTDALAEVSWWDQSGVIQKQEVNKINGWDIRQISIKDGYRLECRQPDLGLSFPLVIHQSKDTFLVTLPIEELAENGDMKLHTFRLLPRFGAAREGEAGYAVIPKQLGGLCYFAGKEPGEYLAQMYGDVPHCNMPIFGMIRDKSGFTGIVTSGKYDMQLCISTNWGANQEYGIDPMFIIRSFEAENPLQEDLAVRYQFFHKEDASWQDMARQYRQYRLERGDVRPLQERVGESPELDYSSKAMEVRLRLGVKPVPYVVKEQTPETEPPVRVFLTFEKVRKVMDAFKRKGIDDVEFCLVGWNKGGHDGRNPQLFPVEESLGGETELRKTITYGQSLGYQLVGHDCYYDSYSIGENWSPDFVRKLPDGSLFKGGQWGGGQSYNVCLDQAHKLFASTTLPRIRDLGFRGLHYSDVLSILGPRPCYDPDHPATRTQDADAANRILQLAKDIFGGIQSEGPLDFTAPFIDRILYVYFNKNTLLEPPYIDESIPLYPMVYHGIILYNISNETLNSEPGDITYLDNMSYGATPAVCFYWIFRSDAVKRVRDYRYDSEEDLEANVTALGKVYQDFKKMRHLQFEFMEGYNNLADGVYETIYSNGERLIVNYNEQPHTLPSGLIIPARGYLLE